MDKLINIGIDLGPTSVAIAMIDEKGKPVEKPIIRLFADACDVKGKPNNQSRRMNRHLRRTISRKKTRRKDAIKLFKKYFKKTDEQLTEILSRNVEMVIKSKVKGLNEKISTEEQITCLFHYLKHRGHFHNIDISETKLPSQLQIDFFQNKGFYRNNENALKFSHKQWLEEINKFFQKQEFSKEFQKEYVDLFKRKREYAYGPGSLKSISPFGLRENEYDQNGNPKVSLWSSKIGKCTFLPDENRCLKKTTSFEICSLVEKLNNLTFRDQNGEIKYINKPLKYSYFSKLFSGDPNTLSSLKKNIVKELNVKKVKDIAFITREGKELTKKEDPIKNFKLDHTLFCIDIFKKSPINGDVINWDCINQFNVLSEIISQYIHDDCIVNDIVTLPNSFIEEIRKSKLAIDIDDNKIKTKFETYLSEHWKLYSGVSRVSLKAIEKALPYFFENEKENWQLLCSRNIFFKNELTFDKLKTQLIQNIGSPSVKRAVEQFFIIFDKLNKKIIEKQKYKINSINVEVAKERNSYEKRQAINEGKKFKEEYYQRIIDDEFVKFGLDPYKNNALQKFYLGERQDWKDPYDGSKLDPDKVKKDPTYVQIDHIYAFSWSGDDSLANKVITLSANNKTKDNKTVAEYLGSKQDEMAKNVWSNFVKIEHSDVERIARLNNKETDKNKFSGFIGRNLSDTRYITNVVYDLLKSWKKSTYPDDKITINTVNGKFTRWMDKFLWSKNYEKGYKKNRDEYKHHGIDAILIAYARFVSQQIQSYIVRNNLNENDGGVLLEKQWCHDIQKKCDDANILDYINDSSNFNFSIPIIKKPKNTLHNDTLYSYKSINTKEGRTKNLYFEKINVLDSKIGKNEWIKIFNRKNDLCAAHNKGALPILDALRKIVDEYQNNDKQNPFIQFMKDEYNEENPKYLRLDKKIFKELTRDYKVSELKCATQINDINDVYFNKKQSNNSIFKGLEWRKIMVYKANDQWCFIPLNCCFYTTITNKNKKTLFKLNYDKILDELKPNLNESQLSKGMTSKEIVNSYYKFSIYRNDIVCNGNFIGGNVDCKNQIFKIAGFDFRNNTIEMKRIDRANLKDKRIKVGLNNFAKYFSLRNSNILGKLFVDKNRIFK